MFYVLISKRRTIQMKEWLLQERQYYFVKTIPKVNDRLVFSSLPIEKAVIYTLEAEEIFKKNVKPYKHKSKLYKECLQVLNKRELAVFNAVVWGFHCDIQKEEMQEVYKQSINKLCDFMKNRLNNNKKMQNGEVKR